MEVDVLSRIATVEGHQVTYDKRNIYFDPQYNGPVFPKQHWMDQLNVALIRARCNTPNRVALFLSQLIPESGSFRYTQELADGSEYNGRADLGNIYPGDGPRFKGRTYIQITGRHNYAALSAWAFAKKLVPTRTFFVDHPAKLAELEYIFLGPIWYWTVARNMNYYADHGDIAGGSTAVNGARPANNEYGRELVWNNARPYGERLLPGKRAYRLAGWKHAPEVVKPPPRHAVKPKPKPVPKPTKIVVVHSGETLSLIASRNHTTWQRLQKLNNLRNPNHIYVGQRLRVS